MNDGDRLSDPGEQYGCSRLGVISPDHPDVPIDYELLRLGDWLRKRGVRDVDVVVEFAGTSGGGHVKDALLQVGSVEALTPPASRLADRHCGAIVFGCTSGSFIGGLAWARLQARTIRDSTGIPYTSATLALIEAVRAIGATSVDLLSPYPDPVTDALQDCLTESGISVAVRESLGAPDGPASFALDILSEVRRFHRKYGNRRSPVLLPDTAINTLDVVGQMETVVERTVVTANQACLWHGLSLIGQLQTIADAGSLLNGEVRPISGASELIAEG